MTPLTPLTPERWQQIDALFAEALERPPAARAAWLDAACAGDPALRQHVLALLDSAAESEAVLGESVSAYAGAIVAEVQAELARGDEATLPLDGRIGPYRLLREIGRGGMGAVYLAERADAEFHKRVALKLVKRGMDTDEVLLRFRYERQILASLEHPNIARLYDGGAAADGRPYLVMEHVEGEPITRYCDAHGLPIEARLHLFAEVCEAVQFAHRSLVVHRDIKPSNVLVGSDGRPKLLDFGIAKLLDPRDPEGASRTRTGLRLLTPEYAPPEQRSGAPATTAADVYSLGTVLYELLAGRRPESATGAERPSAVVTRSRAGGPPPDGVARLRSTTPDRLRRRLRGDLDTIVLRALADDPAQRYPSAEQLLADLRRHLDGLPVQARGASVRYRASKFVRRHRAAAGAAGLVTVSLVGGLAAALWHADRAARERDEARQERARAEQVSGFVLGLFEAANPMSEPGGDTLRVRSLVDLGAERVRRELAGQPRLQAQMLTTLGGAYVGLGLYEPAESLFREAMRLSAAGHEREWAHALAARVEIAERRDDYATVDSLSVGVTRLYEARAWAADGVLLGVLSRRAGALDGMGRFDEGRALHERALALAGPLAAADGGKTRGQLLNNLGNHFARTGDAAAAEPLLRESLELTRRTAGADHPDVAGGLNNLATVVSQLGRPDEVEALYREAIGTARRAYGDDHPYVGQFVENLGVVIDRAGRHAEAEPLLREALRVKTAALGTRSPSVALLQRNLAANRYAVGDYAGAEALLRPAVATLEAEYGRGSMFTALTMASLGRTLTALGRAEEAVALLRASVATLDETLPEGNRWRAEIARSQLGAALAARGDAADAEPLLLRGYTALLEMQGPDDSTTREARGYLHRFYTARGQPERAKTYADATGTAGHTPR
jgi:eukaryotic-like serine/threonine-protein kinase